MKRLAMAALALLATGGAAHAFSNCMQISSLRPDLTCVPLTELLLVDLEGATKAEVVEAMRTEGILVDHDKILHFVSTDQDNGGFLNFRFENDRAVIIFGRMDAGQFIWNQANSFACSDLPGSRYAPCNKEK